MSELTQARLRAAVVAVVAVVVLISLLYHPYVTDFTDQAAFADEVAGDPTRWAWSSIIAAVGLALTVLLAFSLPSYLKAAGELTWSFIAAPLLTAGAVLIAYIGPGSELGLTTAIEAGASGQAVIDAATRGSRRSSR